MPSITLSTISHPMTDAARLARAGQQVGAPKIALPNSFILHAPLEFMARAALLAHVEPSGRDAALDRITWLGNTYEAAGDEVSAPDTTGFPWSTAGATARLTAAVSDGDVDGADVAATWMADHLDPVALAGEVTDLVIPALAAAGHGSIFLDLLIRTDPASLLAAPFAESPGNWHALPIVHCPGSSTATTRRTPEPPLTPTSPLGAAWPMGDDCWRRWSRRSPQVTWVRAPSLRPCTSPNRAGWPSGRSDPYSARSTRSRQPDACD